MTGTVRTANPRRRPAAATCASSVREAGASVFCHSVRAVMDEIRRAAGQPMVHDLRATVDAIGHVVRNDPPEVHSVPRPEPIEALATVPPIWESSRRPP